MEATETGNTADSTSRRGQRLIFVGGPPRSGTTLVQNILDSHPEICGGPEFDNIPNIVGLRNMMLESLKKGRTDVFMDRELLDSRVVEFIESFLLPYADRRRCRFVSEKTPFNVFVFAELLELFPAAKLILCVRDPRAVAASMLKVGERAQSKSQKFHPFTLDLDAAIRAIQHCFEKGFAVVPHQQVFVAQYEELIRRPAETTRRLCDFLAVPFDDAMLHPERVQHDGDKTLDDMWYGRNDYYREITAVGSQKWQDQLCIEDVQKINAAFIKDLRLAQLGYRFADAGAAPVAVAPIDAHSAPPRPKRGGPASWPVIRYLLNARR